MRYYWYLLLLLVLLLLVSLLLLLLLLVLLLLLLLFLSPGRKRPVASSRGVAVWSCNSSSSQFPHLLRCSLVVLKAQIAQSICAKHTPKYTANHTPESNPPTTSRFGHRTKRQTHIDIRGFLSHEGSPVVTIGFNWKNSFQHMNQICGPRLDEMLSQHLGEESTGHVC